MFNNWCFFNGLDLGDLFDKMRRRRRRKNTNEIFHPINVKFYWGAPTHIQNKEEFQNGKLKSASIKTEVPKIWQPKHSQR